jgi:hypothetical protein
VPILADDKRAANAGNPQGFYEYEPVKGTAHDASWLKQAGGKAVKVVAPLLAALPRVRHAGCRVILMERDLDEVVASQRRLLSIEGRLGARMPDAVLRDSLARRLQSAKRLLALRNTPTLVVSHSECLSAPADVAARVNRFLGGTLDEAAMAAVVNPALRTQSNPTG